jgi:hypothetical protein
MVRNTLGSNTQPSILKSLGPIGYYKSRDTLKIQLLKYIELWISRTLDGGIGLSLGCQMNLELPRPCKSHIHLIVVMNTVTITENAISTGDALCLTSADRQAGQLELRAQWLLATTAIFFSPGRSIPDTPAL